MATIQSFDEEIQGAADEGDLLTGFPVLIAGKDNQVPPRVRIPLFDAATGGLVMVFPGGGPAVVTFADVNSTQPPGPVTEQRVAADLLVQDPVANVSNRVRSANSINAGVGGGALIGAGLGIWDGSLFQTLRQVTTSDGGAGVGIPGAAGMLRQSAALWSAIAATSALSTGDTGTRIVPVAPWLHNGTNYDRALNSVEATVFGSASRTTTQTSSDIIAYNLTGITVVLDVTVAGTGSVTLTIDGKDPASGKYYNLLTGLAVTTISTNVYRIQSGLLAVANKDVGAEMPRTIRIRITANNVNPMTYTVGYSAHP